MEATHDTHKTGGFWSIANVLLGLGFGGFALVAGGSLISQAISFNSVDKLSDVPMPAVSQGTSGTPTTTAPAPAGGVAPNATPIPATSTAAASPSTTAVASTSVATANGVTSVTIHPSAANPMAYDTNGFTVKSGAKVKVIFANDSKLPLQHNLIICKPGAKDKVLAEAMAMLSDPNGLAKGYVPDSADILWHTKLLNPNTSETLEFTAPAPGEYPYFCSFPGHAILMNGTMKVE